MSTPASTQTKTRTAESYQPKNFERLLGTPGFSDTLLKNHFKLYEGYVKQTNALISARQELVKQGRHDSPEFAETTRRFGWEFNGMRLHELYFGNMGGDGKELASSEVIERIDSQYGQFSTWQTEFLSVAAMRGIGWALLMADSHSNRLFNIWVNEHDTGHLAGLTPLLVLDVFEHAWITDYGLDRKQYLDAFMKTVDWRVVDSRLTPNDIR